MRKSLRASILLLALCFPVFAGDIPNPPVAPPPPSTPEEGTTDGQMDAPPLAELIITLFGLF
ncbi:MAG TPA: hypothetical protein VER32_08910 [Pyrinomonadaceae bacterium]|nr:hypothetical protein [Pyrinomonadaceae bacterium]